MTYRGGVGGHFLQALREATSRSLKGADVLLKGHTVAALPVQLHPQVNHLPPQFLSSSSTIHLRAYYNLTTRTTIVTWTLASCRASCGGYKIWLLLLNYKQYAH